MQEVVGQFGVERARLEPRRVPPIRKRALAPEAISTGAKEDAEKSSL